MKHTCTGADVERGKRRDEETMSTSFLILPMNSVFIGVKAAPHTVLCVQFNALPHCTWRLAFPVEPLIEPPSQAHLGLPSPLLCQVAARIPLPPASVWYPLRPLAWCMPVNSCRALNLSPLGRAVTSCMVVLLFTRCCLETLVRV